MKQAMIRFQTLALLVVCFSSAGAGFSQDTLSYVDLVKRLVDLEHIATLPQPGETSKQWSSYDRSSQYDAEIGTYVKWDANGDGGHMIRQEGDSWVMAEMKGPGCIFRIWSALSKMGHVKIYLDGQQDPAVDLPFKEYFTGKTAPFNYPALSYHLADQGCRGENLYFPIPYQKSCKIVAKKDWGAYYHFNYMTFPKGTKVPTFSADLSPESLNALKEVNDFLENSIGADPAGSRPGENVIQESVYIPAGGTESLLIEGPQAITALKAMVDVADRKEQEAFMRKLIVRMTFDDEKEPSVWCPLGDFCGTAPGINLYTSLTTGMTKDGLYSYWYMPFAKSARLELVNLDSVDRHLDVEIVHAPLTRPFRDMGHFHCKWHRDIFPLSEDRWPDWTMLRTKGRGRFCGVMLHVWNAPGGWWGEGDEKFFVDGEAFPSTFGTGSEDYFGYAWCHPGLFQQAFHCQTMTQNNRGHQSVLRWQISDNIPFQTSFEACIEKYYRNKKGTLYACVPCWYLAPGGNDPIGETDVETLHDYYVTLPLGGGGYLALGKPNGVVQDQEMGGFGANKWSGNSHLWWTNAKPGDKLDILLKAKEAGTYRVTVKLTKAIDYGIVQLYVNGNRAGTLIDLFNDGVAPTGPIAIGTHKLEKGKNTLTVEIKGANKKAVKSYMFGLDEIILAK
jgi:hypothetical protein